MQIPEIGKKHTGYYVDVQTGLVLLAMEYMEHNGSITMYFGSEPLPGQKKGNPLRIRLNGGGPQRGSNAEEICHDDQKTEVSNHVNGSPVGDANNMSGGISATHSKRKRKLSSDEDEQDLHEPVRKKA